MVSEEKDLGVVIDSNLQFDNHILGKVKTANRIPGLIKRCFKNLEIQSFMLLYKALVCSHLEYAQIVWTMEPVQGQVSRGAGRCPKTRDKDPAWLWQPDI